MGNTSDVPKCVEKLLKMLWQFVEEKERNDAKVKKESLLQYELLMTPMQTLQLRYLLTMYQRLSMRACVELL